MSNSYIWLIDRTQSDATIPGQCGPGNDGKEELLSIPKSFIITEASQSDC